MTSTQGHAGKKNAIAVVLLHIAAFFLAGPIVGDPILILLMSFSIPSTFTGIGRLASDLALAIPFAYLFGGLAAAFTGLVVGIFSLWTTKSKWLFLIAAATGGTASIANFILVGRVPDRNPAVIFFLTGAVSAMICTALTKRFRRNGHNISSEAEHLPGISA